MRRGARGDGRDAQGDHRDPRAKEDQAPHQGGGQGHRDYDGRPLAPPPERQLSTAFREAFHVRGREDQSTAFREDFNMRGRKDHEYKIPRDRRGGDWRYERGQQVLFEKARGQQAKGVNPA